MFDSATFDCTASSFDNADFVDVVIHSYRHRFGYSPGDPGVAAIEGRLARQPDITVPSALPSGLSAPCQASFFVTGTLSSWG